MAQNSTLKILDRDDPKVVELLDSYPFTRILLEEHPVGARGFFDLTFEGMMLFCVSNQLAQKTRMTYWDHPASLYSKQYVSSELTA